MAVIRRTSEIPDILPLMNGQDTSLLYISEDIQKAKIKSRYRESYNDSVKSSKSMHLYDPEVTGTLAGGEELTLDNTTYDVSTSTDNVKSSYSDVITPTKFSLKNKSPSGSTGNLAHGSQITVNGGIGHTAIEAQKYVEGSSPLQSTVSSVAHANLNSMNGDMQGGNNQEPMVNGNISTEHVELTSTGISNNNAVDRSSSENRTSSAQQEHSNRNSQADSVGMERTESTKRSATVKKSGSFQIRSSLDSNRESNIESNRESNIESNRVSNRESYHSETSSQGTSIAGSADITVSTNGVNEEAHLASNQEIRRHSSGASNKARQESRPVSTGSNSAPSYMRDTNASQAKRSSRTSERTPSVSSDKPPLYRSTSKSSNSGSRPPSGQVTAVRTSVSSTRRSERSASQSPPPSPTKIVASSRSSSTRRSDGSVRQTSPQPSNRESVATSRSSSVKRGDSFTRHTPPASPTKVSGTPPRTPSFNRSDSNSAQSPPTSPSKAYPAVRTSSSRSSASRSSSASREGRPRKPSQDYTSPVRDSSTAGMVVTETSVTRSSRSSVASSPSSKPPSRTPSAAKPPSGSTQVSRQSSQRRASSSSASTPLASNTSTKERGVGNFVMKHAPGSDGVQGDSTPSSSIISSTQETRTYQTSTPKPSTSDEFELSANVLSSQKAQLKTNGYTPKARNFVDTNKSQFTAGQAKSSTSKFHVNTSHTTVGVGSKPSVTSPTDVVVSSPVSPMEEMRSTVKSGRVGKLIKDFKSTPLTGRVFDPSSLERQKKAAESPTRKFKFSVEGIDVPLSPTADESYASSIDKTTHVTPLTPGTVPPPPPISPAILSQIASSTANKTTATTTATTITTTATTKATEESPTSPVPAPPPPPPPPDFSDTPTNMTPMNSLEREKKRGFTYILDDAVVPEMKKKAESVMARKPHETVEEQAQKRSSDIIHDHEVATLREARAKLNRQEKSPPKPMPLPPNYSTATTDADAVIKVSSDTQKSSSDVRISSGGSQKSSSDVQISSVGAQKSSSDVQISSGSAQKSSSDVQISSGGAQKSSFDVQMTNGGAQKSSSDVRITGGDAQKSGSAVRTPSTSSQRTSIEIQKTRTETQVTNVDGQKAISEAQELRKDKQRPSSEAQTSSSGDQTSSSSAQQTSSTTSVNMTTVNVSVKGGPEVSTNQTKQSENVTAAPPASPVKSQRSPDSAYHSDAQSPNFDLGKTLAPSHSNIESSQEVTVQRAAIESQQAARARPGQSHSETRQSFQSETQETSGQSASDSAAAATIIRHQEPGPPQDTSSPLPASYKGNHGLLTTATHIEADPGPLRRSSEDYSDIHGGTLHTEILSTNNRQVRDSRQDDQDKFSVHIQPAQGPQRIAVGSQHSPSYSNSSYSLPQGDNYSSLTRSESNYNHRQNSIGPRYYTAVNPGPPSRQGHYGHPGHPGHPQRRGSPGSRVVPLQPVSVDINLADRYSPRSPNSRHLRTIHGMSAMAGEVMQPFNNSQMSHAGGRHYDYNDGRFVSEQYNFSTYERSSGTRQLNNDGSHHPDMDRNSSINVNSSLNFNSNAPKHKYLKVDESRSNGRVPMYNGDLESYEYHQYNNRSPRYKINSARSDNVFEDESIRSEPGYRHQRHVVNSGGGGGHSTRRLQKHSALSRSQPHLNELGQPNSLGEPLYVSVPHSPPRYGTLRSARSETMLAQQSPSGGDGTLLLPHLEDAKSKSRAKYPYHITLKLNQLAGSRPGSSHMSLQRSSRDGYYNSLQSERNHSQSLSGLYAGGKRPNGMHTSSVSLVNIEGDPRSPSTGQQPARYREDGSYSRQEKYSYQQQQQQQLQQLQLQHQQQLQQQQQNQQHQDSYIFNGSYPASHVESSTQVISTTPQKMGEKEFFLNIDNLPENERVNNNYIFKTSNQQTNERVNKRQNKQQILSGKDPDFTMAINQTMTMDYLPKKKKREEEPPPRRQKVRSTRRYEDEMENYLSPAEDEVDQYSYREEMPRVERGSYLIKNSIDTTSAPQHFDVVGTDDLDESFVVEHNNLFSNKYVTRRDNPGYVSDEEEEVYIEKRQQKPQFTNIFERTETTQEEMEDMVDIPVSYTTSSYETSFSKQDRKPARKVDRTDYEERVTKSSSAHQRSEPRMQSSSTMERVEITEHELERLLKSAPPGSVKQTINVEREEEEILGPLPITHADGEESAAEGLLNFDTVSEKVELGIVNGNAQLTVKVRCERVVPIRGVDDMFKKSSVIVTRLITIDMAATKERRHLLDNIMAGATKRTLNESTGHVRHSSQKMLNTKDTFQLYKTFMAMAEAEEGRDTTGEMHVEKRLEDERGLPDHAEFDIRTEDVDERVFGEPVEMEFDTDDLERRLESQMMSNGITNGTRLEAMPNGRGHVIKAQDPDTISYRSVASDNSGIIY